jgi:hypothetical protein
VERVFAVVSTYLLCIVGSWPEMHATCFVTCNDQADGREARDRKLLPMALEELLCPVL